MSVFGAGSEIGKGYIEVSIPIFTASEANGGVKKTYVRNGKTCYKSEHWTDKHKRHKQQKKAVYWMLLPLKQFISLPCLVILTRYAPRKLDKHDNLPISLKWVLDAVCEVITGDKRAGRADGCDEISVAYNQTLSKDYGVKIRIEGLKC